jgi:hypothetical protein
VPDTIKQLQLQRRMDALETEYHDKRDPKVKKEFERLSTELARLKVNQVVDSKEKALVKEIRGKIIRKKYDEIDILGLLVLLRGYSSEGSATFEFANFVAHRERDRGAIYDYLVEGTKQFYLALKK